MPVVSPGASALPPLPPPLAVPAAPLHRLRALLMWGFGVSIMLHAILGPIVGTYRTPITDAPEISVVTLSQRATVKVPTPTPTPQPTPPPTPPPQRITPRPALTPPPHAAPPQAHLKINVLKTTSKPKTATLTEPKYRDQPGSHQGVPQGTLASAPASAPQAGAGSASSGVGTPAQPVRTPTPPACAAPNVEAKATQVADPVYPESAQQLGVSGTVDVLVSLSATGEITAASIYRSSGSAALDQAAMRAARASTYSPDIVECQPVAGAYTFHVSFQRL